MQDTILEAWDCVCVCVGYYTTLVLNTIIIIIIIIYCNWADARWQ